MGFKAVSFNNIGKNKFGSKKTSSIKTDKFDGKDKQEELVIRGNARQTNEMKTHLEKEHPSTRGRMHIEKPDYYKHSSGEYQNTERLRHGNNTTVSQDFLYDRESKSKTLTSKNGELKSYDTVIAKKTGAKEITVTDKKYSVTTSKQVSQLKREAERNGYTVKVGFEEPKDNRPDYIKEPYGLEKGQEETGKYKGSKPKENNPKEQTSTGFKKYNELSNEEKADRRQIVYDNQGIFSKLPDDMKPKDYDREYEKIIKKKNN